MAIRAARATSTVHRMGRSLRIICRAPLATLFMLVVLPARADGIAIHMDNDLFSGSGSDRDYSWGTTLTFASPEPGPAFAPVNAARRGLASLLPGRPSAAISRASQVGIIAMTPEDITQAGPQRDDRPYASLVYLTSSELRVAADGERARFTSFTVGVLGTGVAESLQRGVHSLYGGDLPGGWSHQVSDGGEPTARFVLAEQQLLADSGTPGGGLRQLKLTWSGSLGYLTEAGAAISMRWGRIQSPWWTFNPELGDYAAAPIAPFSEPGFGGPSETYAFVGARVKLRAYDALLQGQFRDSDVTVAGGDIARVQAEAWAGIASVFSDWQLTYSLHVASREITAEPAARTLVWASVSLARSF